MRIWAVTAATALVLVTAGCGEDEPEGNGAEEQTLRVYAAASLTKSFEEIEVEFEDTHAGVDVEFSFAGSSDLVVQIQEGAPADVFASADTANMDKLVADDLTGEEPQNFATNTLEIAVPPGNPAGVEDFADLAEDGLNLVICAPEVPCGAAAAKAAEAAGVTLRPVSEEQSVTDVLAKVASEEADAGLVYVTDVIAGDDVEGISFPESASAVNTYPIATVADSDQPDLAQEFVDLVLGETGQSILAHAGFGQP
jgi:molybdate transport system substrate-binding protein